MAYEFMIRCLLFANQSINIRNLKISFQFYVSKPPLVYSLHNSLFPKKDIKQGVQMMRLCASVGWCQMKECVHSVALSPCSLTLGTTLRSQLQVKMSSKVASSVLGQILWALGKLRPLLWMKCLVCKETAAPCWWGSETHLPERGANVTL